MNEEFNLVVKHNDLINKTKIKLTLQEQRIILYLISKIKPNDSVLMEYDFNIDEFCDLIGIKDSRGSNAELKKTLLRLKQKSFELEDNIKGWRVVDWIVKPRILPNGKIVRLQLDDELAPYLLNLKSNFTSFELYYILKFKSKYSIQLFELFKSAEFKKKFEIEIDELQEKLCVNYAKFYDLKRKVIEPALEEINHETDIQVDVEYIKEGRSFKAVRFKIKGWQEKSGQLPLDQLTLDL